MKGHELKLLLDLANPDAEVRSFYDGGDRGPLEGAYVDRRDGSLVLIAEMSIYRDEIANTHRLIHEP